MNIIKADKGTRLIYLNEEPEHESGCLFLSDIVIAFAIRKRKTKLSSGKAVTLINVTPVTISGEVEHFAGVLHANGILDTSLGLYNCITEASKEFYQHKYWQDESGGQTNMLQNGVINAVVS